MCLTVAIRANCKFGAFHGSGNCRRKFVRMSIWRQSKLAIETQLHMFS